MRARLMPRQFAVSIHAPHEGERPVRSLYSRTSRTFQSTLPTRGSDYGGIVRAARAALFQSTLPTRGSDQVFATPQPYFIWFQSTLPTRGSDFRLQLGPFRYWQVSIHAPHEGERLSSIPCAYLRETFQSTLPTRGSDSLQAVFFNRPIMFQSTLPTRGSDITARA